MHRHESVAAVVVTYNRKDVLRLTLNALHAQTRPPDRIIVVDNRSNDGSAKMVAEEFSGIVCVQMSDNGGYGSGLAAGMRVASDGGHDYFWLLDDDSMPRKDALAQCLHVALSTPRFGIVGLSGGDWRRGPRHWRSGHAMGPVAYGSSKLYRCDFVLVDGALVSQDAVCNIGYPRHDFFMNMEDLEYTQRLKRAGWEVVLLDEDLIDRRHMGSGGSSSEVPPGGSTIRQGTTLRWCLNGARLASSPGGHIVRRSLLPVHSCPTTANGRGSECAYWGRGTACAGAWAGQ